MTRTRLLILILGALALAGCSTPTQVDSGPVEARTFSFVARRPQTDPGDVGNRQYIHNLVQAAITKNLASKGLAKVDTGGDVTVGYLIIVGNNASTKAINDYFGYNEDTADLHEKAQDAYSSSENPNYFEAGTLLIDVVDSKSMKLLYRDHATRQILQNVTPDVRAARIQEVVDQILQNLRVKQ